jgi:hypothetical protein
MLLAFLVVYAFDLNLIEQIICLLGGGAANGLIMSFMQSKEEM